MQSVAQVTCQAHGAFPGPWRWIENDKNVGVWIVVEIAYLPARVQGQKDHGLDGQGSGSVWAGEGSDDGDRQQTCVSGGIRMAQMISWTIDG